MKDFFSKEIQKKIYLSDYFTEAVYYRLMIPAILINYEKILYLDCDIVVLKDISKLFLKNIDNYFLAATEDLHVKTCRLIKIDDMKNYLENVLKFTPTEKYFQAGVILMNLKVLRGNNIFEKCLDVLNKVKVVKFADQCLLNLAAKNKICFIDNSWNFTMHPKERYRLLSFTNQIKYFFAMNNPKIVHFIGSLKPWRNFEIKFSEHFWFYAKETPFF